MNRTMINIKKKSLAAAVSATLLGMASLGYAAPADSNLIDIQIDSKDADAALMELARQSGIQIIMSTEIGVEKQLVAVDGEYTFEQALSKILEGSGLTYQFISSDSVVVSKENTEEESEPKGESAKDVDEEIVVTGSRLINDPGKQTKQMTIFTREEIERSGINRLDEFLNRLPQNVNAPNNVGGGFVGDGFGQRDFGLGNNVFAGSGVNLRGLGSQYTLILIDGRRPSSGGQFGGITDISNIPIDRVERIEILFDGAASVYGADAIGGVVNIITNREYEGTNIALTIEETADGGGKRYNFNIGRTFSWDTGSLTSSISYQTQDAIDGAERDLELIESRDFSLPPSLPGTVGGFPGGELLPGVDRQAVMWVRDVDGDGRYDTESLDERITGGVRFDTVSRWSGEPTTGTVYRENPVLASWQNQPNDPDLLDNLAANRPQDNGYIPVRVIQVPESDGQMLSLYDVDLSNYQAVLGNEGVYADSAYEPRSGQSLSPEDETYSLGLALDQELTENLSFSLSANYSKTEKRNNTRGGAEEFTVQGTSLTNPFETPIQYVWANSFPQQYQESQIDSYSLTGDLNWQVNDDWEVIFGWGLGKTDQSSDSFNELYRDRTRSGQVILRNLLDGYYFDENFDRVPIEGTVFHDPLLGFDTVEELIDTVVNPLIHTENNSYSRDMDINIRGVLAELPGGELRTNFTLSHQRSRNEIFNDNETFSVSGNEVLNNVGDDFTRIGGVYREEYGETVNAFGFEVAAPLIGQDNAMPLVQDFLISASARIEDYSTVEDNGELWSVGFNWQLTDSMAVRVNRDHGVRIPGSVRSARPLEGDDCCRMRIFADETQEEFVAWQNYFGISGGARHLEPEISNNVKVGFIFTPTFIEGLRAELSFTEQEVEEQIGVPGVAQILTPGILADLQVTPQPTMFIATQPFIDSFTAQLPDDYVGDLPTVGALVRDQRVYNVGTTRQQGADLELRYNLSSLWGDWFVTWRHQYLRKSEILQSDICATGDCLSAVESTIFDQPEEFNEFIDIVGIVDEQEFEFKSQVYNALPEHRSSLEVFWQYRGLGVSLRTDYTTDTRLVVLDRDYDVIDGVFTELQNRREITTRPTRALDATLSYEFSGGLFKAPDWLQSTRVSLTINDLWRREQEITQRYLSQEFTPDQEEFSSVNGYAIDPRGRSLSLNITSTF